jgi:hypothetical protein
MIAPEFSFSNAKEEKIIRVADRVKGESQLNFAYCVTKKNQSSNFSHLVWDTLAGPLTESLLKVMLTLNVSNPTMVNLVMSSQWDYRKLRGPSKQNY